MSPGSWLSTWQSRLLPFMILMIVGLAIFFVAATLSQFSTLQERVAAAPKITLADDGWQIVTASRAPDAGADLARASWTMLAKLEANTIAQRYHLARVTLMARMWARYLGFVTGMILALVGSAFVLGKLREASSTVNVDASFAKVAVVSTSPGIVLAVLGTSLMLATILTNPEIKVSDAPIYMSNVKVEAQATGDASRGSGSPATFHGVAPDEGSKIIEDMKKKAAVKQP